MFCTVGRRRRRAFSAIRDGEHLHVGNAVIQNHRNLQNQFYGFPSSLLILTITLLVDMDLQGEDFVNIYTELDLPRWCEDSMLRQRMDVRLDHYARHRDIPAFAAKHKIWAELKQQVSTPKGRLEYNDQLELEAERVRWEADKARVRADQRTKQENELYRQAEEMQRKGQWLAARAKLQRGGTQGIRKGSNSVEEPKIQRDCPPRRTGALRVRKMPKPVEKPTPQRDRPPSYMRGDDAKYQGMPLANLPRAPAPAHAQLPPRPAKLSIPCEGMRDRLGNRIRSGEG